MQVKVRRPVKEKEKHLIPWKKSSVAQSEWNCVITNAYRKRQWKPSVSIEVSVKCVTILIVYESASTFLCIFLLYLCIPFLSPCRCKMTVFQCYILATSFQSKCRKHLKYFTHLPVDSTTFPKVNEYVKSFVLSASDEHYSIDVPFRFDRFTLRFCDSASFTHSLCGFKK